jgi:hypothetical protein
MPISMKDIRALPGEVRTLVGYIDEIVVKEPTDRDHENAAKYKREAKTKYYMVFSPNRLESRNVKFDPEKYPVSKLKTLEGSCCEIACEVNTYEFTDEQTKQVKRGETADFVKLVRMFRDANGEEPKAG